MHLAFLTSEYPHQRTTLSAGIGTSIKNIAAELLKKGWTISIFVYNQREDDIFKDSEIEIHLIKQRKYKIAGWYYHRKYLQNYLNKFIKANDIDVLEVPDWTGISAFMKLKCPIVLRLHGSDTYFCSLENRKQKRKNYLFEYMAVKNANTILSVSHFTANKTKELFNIKKPINVIPNSLNLDNFKLSKSSLDHNRLLYFGSIIRKKGVIELAHIFNIINQNNPDCILVIAGKDSKDILTGRSTKDLMREILSEGANEKTKWLGQLPYENVKTEISKATVISLPSFAEAFPMTWIESMAMEKAIVTSNIGWAKEIIDDGITGFTVNPKNHKDFSEKIELLFKNDKLRYQMGKMARRKVIEHFSSKIIANKYDNFLSQIIHEHK
ncbi:glycosyltransferase involved in cell wall biosynthesis [Christiangramia gaetbulicola]|uniref:Glycosyltransferase involved in cell wall biosynthesis n=1 Tax=Christiangramia gaetbulicola TaxID=703340 RepID=A0A2T6AJV7_9FLAO|nr:glycosyltransferase family 4 protein [Christiangramia gaetbulicola]PTX44094.1 glycosyltransferase involved in cell wall biosynthesis [Christiangramia gaetbulicola]